MTRPTSAEQAAAGLDAVHGISSFLAGTRYDDLPAETVVNAKVAVLDVLACIYAGNNLPDVRRIADSFAPWSAELGSTLVGLSRTGAPDIAALINAAATHQNDFDDIHEGALCHTSAPAVIPALALAEHLGNKSGRDLLAAVAVASELTIRLGLAVTGGFASYPWIRAPVMAQFGAAAAASKVLGASAEQHANALGLTLPQIGGTFASLEHAGSSVRGMRDGFTCRNGIQAATMAVAGVQGEREVFEGPFGLFQVYFRGEYERGIILDQLGTKFHLSEITLKPWPCCRHLHGPVTALFNVMGKYGLTFEHVREVTVRVGKANMARCREPVAGSIPAQRIDLLCSLPFILGAALYLGDVPLDIYTDGAKADAIIEHSVPRIRWQYESSQNDDRLRFEAGNLELKLWDGQTLTSEARHGFGHPANPMTQDQIRSKFINCAQNSRAPMSIAVCDQILETIMNLESKSVLDLTSLLVAGGNQRSR